MLHPESRKEQIARQLGVSVQVLEQYLQLKQAEVTPPRRSMQASAKAGIGAQQRRKAKQ